MRRPKICFFIPSFGGGGAERQFTHLVNALNRRSDIDVLVVHFHEGINFALLEESVRKLRIATRSNYDPRNILWAKRVFAREQPDVVFSWLHACDAYAWGARALGGKFKWVMAERNSQYPRDPRFVLRDLVGRTADLIISNSRQGDEYWANRRVPRHRRASVENILTDDWFVESVKPSPRDLICYAGRLEPQKNISLLVQAFVALSKRRGSVKCVVVGQGSLSDSLETLALQAMPGSITFHTFQPQIRSMFDRAAVFVNLSHHEGMPNTVIENLALGNRLVLSRIPEHVNLVGEDYPFLVDRDMPAEAIATLLERAIDTPVSEREKSVFRRRLEPMRAERVIDAYVRILAEVAGH